MSDAENDSKDFCVDRAKAGRALCKKCKGKLPAGELRVGKVVPNHFGSGLVEINYFNEKKNSNQKKCISSEMVNRSNGTI